MGGLAAAGPTKCVCVCARARALGWGRVSFLPHGCPSVWLVRVGTGWKGWDFGEKKSPKKK